MGRNIYHSKLARVLKFMLRVLSAYWAGSKAFFFAARDDWKATVKVADFWQDLPWAEEPKWQRNWKKEWRDDELIVSKPKSAK